MSFEVTGKDVALMDNEAGGHRIQRVPPTERWNRTHTSTVTVASIEPGSTSVEVKDEDFRVEFFSGTGKGGQHRNKKQTSARVTHIPSGLTETRQGRNRESNVSDAKRGLIHRIKQSITNDAAIASHTMKKNQMGSGERGDKRRTYRFQEGMVKDHITGRSASIDKVLSGEFWRLW